MIIRVGEGRGGKEKNFFFSNSTDGFFFLMRLRERDLRLVVGAFPSFEDGEVMGRSESLMW